MADTLIVYRCNEPRHQIRVSEPRASPITVVEGNWAYCPMGAPDMHTWERVKPVSLAEILGERFVIKR
jgi:hypothetical protein